jgi:hypothetical protein
MDDFTFRLGATGVVLNTDASSFPFVDIEEARGFDSAPFRETQRDHEGDDGGFIDAEFEKGRDLALTGTLYSFGASMETYLDDLKDNWGPSPDQIPLYFQAPGVPERLLLVKPLGVAYDWNALRRLGKASIQFKAFAEDPRIYDSALVSQTANLSATVYTGFGFNFGFNFGFGGVSVITDAMTVTNTGNRPTPPVFTITGPVTNPRILNDTLSKEMVFTTVLGAGETLVVDAKNKTVRLNGTTNRRNTLVSADSWFYLARGANSIRYRAESADPVSSLNVQFRPAWR